MIRDATPDDAEALIKMGAAYVEEAGLPARFGIEFCPQSFLATCEALAKMGVMLVAEHEGEVVGMLGAAFVPFLWNHNARRGQAVWWYVRPDRRKGIGVALLREFERRATTQGVAVGGMVAELGPRGDAVGRLYQAKGYAPAETVHLKRLAVA